MYEYLMLELICVYDLSFPFVIIEHTLLQTYHDNIMVVKL